MIGDYNKAYAMADKIYNSNSLWAPMVALACAGFTGNGVKAGKPMREILQLYPNFMENTRPILERLTTNKQFIELT